MPLPHAAAPAAVAPDAVAPEARFPALAASAERATRQWKEPALGMVACFLSLACPLAAGEAHATSCVVPSQTGETPAYITTARARMLDHQPAEPGGYGNLLAQTQKNREDFAAGRITAGEAEARGGFLVDGNRTIPVLPVLYDDIAAEPFAVDDMQGQLFGATGSSMYDYFVENSYDQLFVTGTVFDFQRLSGNDFDYTGFDSGLSGGAAQMVWEALVLNDPTVDFGQFDNNGPDGIPNSGDDDGVVDIVTVIHPEIGAECTGNFHDIWSHQSFLDAHLGLVFPTNDWSAEGGTILVNRYFVAPALNCDGGMIEIGVFCHEYGHALGIPDLYDTVEGGVTGDSDGIGFWGLMGSGNWNTPRSPAHMTAFTKNLLGWLDYFDVLQDGPLCLPPVETSPVAARVWKDGVYGTEFFLVENRQSIGFDANLQKPGLVIYHVDMHRYVLMKDTNRVNASEIQKAIDVECPDAVGPGHGVDRDDLDIAGDMNRGDAGDVWCTDGWDSVFGPTSQSDSRAMNNTQTGVTIEVLDPCTGDESGWICAQYKVGVAQPVDLCIPDCEDGDCGDLARCDEYWVSPNIWIDNLENGFQSAPAPGTENKIWFEVQNLGPEVASGAEVSLYMAHAGVGLEWPADADLHVGTMSVPILDVGQTFREHFVHLYPLLLEPESHWCIGAVVQHPQDLSTGTQAWQSNNLAQVNEQVLYARAGTPVGPEESGRGGDCPGPMVQLSRVYIHDGYNPMEKPRTVSIQLGTPPDYNDVVIPPHWELSLVPHAGPFTVSPTTKDSILVKVDSQTAADDEHARIPLTLIDTVSREILGGITINFHVDCVDPAVPEILSASWRDFPGDAFGEFNVIVDWAGVTVDVDGMPDLVERYEVDRSDDGGASWTRVGDVAIDDDPEAGFFQFFDLVPNLDCPLTYRYRVRAIDRAENIGAYSDEIELPCESASSPDETRGSEELGAFPNPFWDQTEIVYHIPGTGPFEVDIFDITGKRIRQLEKRESGPGLRRVVWDGTDESGRVVPRGIYFYRVRGAGAAGIWKLVRSR